MHLVDALNALHSGGSWITSADVTVHYDEIPAEGDDTREWAAMWQVKNVPADEYGWWKRELGFVSYLDIWVIDGYKMMAEENRVGPDLFYTITMKRDDV